MTNAAHLKHIRRWGCLTGVALCATFLIFTALCALYGARRAALEKVLEHATGGHAAVTGPIALRPELSIPGIALDAPAPCAQPALLRINGLDAAYSIPPRDGRVLQSLRIGSIEITPDASAPNAANFDFLLKNGGASTGGDDVPTLFLPKQFAIGEIAGNARLPGGRLDFGGIAVEGGFDDMNHYGATISADAARLAWTLASPATSGAIEAGTLSLLLTREPGTYYLDIDAKLPGIAAVAGKGMLQKRSIAYESTLECSAIDLDGPFWSGLAGTLLPVPLAFDSIHVADARVDAHFSDSAVSMLDAHGECDIAALRVGPEDLPWFTGALHAKTTSAQHAGEDGAFETVVTPENAGPVTIAAKASPEGGIQAEVTSAPQSRQALQTMSPLLAPYLDTYCAALEECSAKASVVRENTAWQTEIAADFRLKEEPPAVLEATVRFEPGAGTLSLPHASLRRDDVASLTLEDGSAALDVSYASAKISAAFDAGALAKSFGVKGPWGDLEVHSTASWRHNAARLDPFALHAETLGYGDWHLPYGVALDVAGAVRIEPAARVARSEKLELSAGEDTRLILTKIAASAPETTINEAVFTTRFALLVALGFLAAATGNAEARAKDLYWRDGAYDGNGTFHLDAESLAFPNGMGAASGVSLASGVYNLGSRSAACDARIGDLDIAGKAHLRDVTGTVTLAEGRLTLTISQATLFKGTLQGAMELDLGAPDLPVHISGTLDKIDLQQFTEEVQPPAARLTGIASGRFDARLHRDGIAALEAKLVCEQGFSINRDVIQELALYTQGVAILGKSIQRAIGDADPRPFDSAELTASYANEIATIGIHVKSRLLDLAPVFDIRTDWAKLFKTIREEGFENIQGFSTAPAPPGEK